MAREDRWVSVTIFLFFLNGVVIFRTSFRSEYLVGISMFRDCGLLLDVFVGGVVEYLML